MDQRPTCRSLDKVCVLLAIWAYANIHDLVWHGVLLDVIGGEKPHPVTDSGKRHTRWCPLRRLIGWSFQSIQSIQSSSCIFKRLWCVLLDCLPGRISPNISPYLFVRLPQISGQGMRTVVDCFPGLLFAISRGETVREIAIRTIDFACVIGLWTVWTVGTDF